MNNNNSSMATVVETFYVEETINLIHDNEALAKWNEKVAELGLEGQKAVIVADKSPVPFLWMNDALIATFETLCPTKAKIQEYNKTPIPVELLDTVSLCVKEQYFDKIEVWFNEKDKDPVIIGYKNDMSQSEKWYQEYKAAKYLIGRWADVKASLDTLVKRAKQLYIEQQTNFFKVEIKATQRKLEDVELTAEEKFGNPMPITNGLPF